MAIRVSSRIAMRWLAMCADGDGSADSEWICPYSLATCTTTSGVFGCCYVDSTGIDCAFETMCIVSLLMRCGDSRGCVG